ncbi:serpentine type 7TM GPCR chemoreceptor str domain-containing protein [Ditylenchus destructor]|nr:serpentine type 7TM GPCR chemoreceptor str domain-containing protein [Ditylenchus destructor]
MDTVHQINSYICLISGIALNLLLVWLIWKKTNGEVRHYSWILLQGCIVDSVYLLVASIVQPRSNDLLWVVCVTIALDVIVFKLIIWLAYQIWYALRISLNQITKEKRSKIFNKQINIALLVQVFLPVIVSSIPIIYLAHAIITKSGIVTVCQLMTIPLHWIPVLNPLSTILIIKQYRSLLLCSGKGDQIVFYSNSRGTLPTDDR